MSDSSQHSIFIKKKAYRCCKKSF